MLNTHVPMGRVVKLTYRDAQPRTVADTSVLDVHFYGPDGQYYCNELPNTAWSLDNIALQLMALNDIRPSDFDGVSISVTDQHWLIQLAVRGYEFRLHQNALSGGREALKNAEWFTPHKTEESNSGQSEPIGGGSNGGGGEFKNSRSGSESNSEQGGGNVTTKLAGDDSNSGFTIEVSN